MSPQQIPIFVTYLTGQTKSGLMQWKPNEDGFIARLGTCFYLLNHSGLQAVDPMGNVVFTVPKQGDNLTELWAAAVHSGIQSERESLLQSQWRRERMLDQLPAQLSQRLSKLKSNDSFLVYRTKAIVAEDGPIEIHQFLGKEIEAPYREWTDDQEEFAVMSRREAYKAAREQGGTVIRLDEVSRLLGDDAPFVLEVSSAPRQREFHGISLVTENPFS